MVYLKNHVVRAWCPEETNQKPIPDLEKETFRGRLLPILAASQSQVRQQLIPTLQKILHFDFPEKWPTFLEITMQLLNTNEATSVFAGLQCLLGICRVYRFKSAENRGDFDNIVAVSFPQLLNIGTRLADESSNEAGEMLRIVMKAYKHATYVCRPGPSRSSTWRGTSVPAVLTRVHPVRAAAPSA